MKKQEKKRIAAMATEIFLQQRNIDAPHSTRRERRENARLLRKRIVKEAPASAFERHGSVLRPQIIIPDVQIQAEGIPTDKEQKRSESGRIIVLA